MNPLAIRIAANLAEFKANMAEMRTQLETNASAMKRMSNSFDGSRVIGDANAMVKAIGDIGGASKLTDSEMRRVNGTVNEAIAKYQALGRQAPSELIALRDATAKVNVETAKTPPLVSGMESRFTALGVAAGTFLGNMAWSAVNKLGAELGEFAARGVQLNAVQSSFERLAQSTNQSSSGMLSSMQKASRGMVAEFDLMKAANKAMLLGLPVTTESMGTLAKAATTLGRAMGQDATKSVDDLITALGRSSPMILDNLGITVKVGEANEIYAAKLGKTVEQLSDAEKKTAFYEEAMRKANDKTKELGESTKTLGERLQTAWVTIGNIVTGVVSDYNVGLGAALSNTKNFGNFLSVAMTQGFGAAVQLFAQMERGKNVVEQLTASEKLAAAALFKKGETVQQVAKFLGQSEAVVQAYANSLKKATTATTDMSAGQKSAKTDAERFAEAVEKQKDKINGIITPSKEWAAAIKEIGMTLMSLPKGPGTGVGFFGSFPAMNDGIRVFNQQLPMATTNVKSFFDQFEARNDVMKDVFGSKDNMQFLPTPEMFDLATGKLIPAAKSAGEKVASGFLSSMSKALEGLGGVIVGAIQGGGDVARSAFAHVGQSLGSDLGAWIQKGLGGTLGKILGGFAGPLGALLGSGLGGLVDKIFGKNQGREDAKGFAAMFGGFDALREKMLVLGEEGDRLWIALTQNTKGPEQVAATIRLIEEAFRKAEAAAAKTGETIKDTFEGPEGARGFPTRAQLQTAAREAEEAYLYIRDSGLYTADVIEQAWNQWQDAMIASGDLTAKRMRELGAEITSVQKAVEAETPEYDAEGVRIYGVEELRNIERLAALEAEKAALNLVQIAEEEHATELAAKEADLQAKKEFEAAKIRANELDSYLKKLFTGGYEIPITFKFPNGAPGGQPSSPPSWFGGSSTGATPAPSGGGQAAFTIVNVTELDGEVVAKKTVKHTAKLLPGELNFTGAWQ